MRGRASRRNEVILRRASNKANITMLHSYLDRSHKSPPLLKVTAITLLVIPNRRDLFFFLQMAPPSPVFNKHRRGVLELQTRGTCPLNKTKKQEQAAAGSACVASRGAWLHLGGVTMMLMLRLSDTDGEVNNGHVWDFPRRPLTVQLPNQEDARRWLWSTTGLLMRWRRSRCGPCRMYRRTRWDNFRWLQLGVNSVLSCYANTVVSS